MDTSRLDNVLQYALAVASKLDWDQRELGPIHLVKYAYLADLSYAEEHGGKTYTGAPWIFYNFGPWSPEVFSRIEPCLNYVHAKKRTVEGKYGEFDRWLFRDEDAIESIRQSLDLGVILAIESAVKEFGSDTDPLLDHVYKTKPMLNAAPKEQLDFSAAKRERRKPRISEFDSSPSYTPRQQKKWKEVIKSRKAAFQERLANKRSKRAKGATPPVYDEAFFEGVEALERLGEADIPEGQFVCQLDDSVWKSKARHDPDLPD
ncbi:MAG: hypothetical protein AB7D07_13830 [Desulfovibrionaceae bacterium]